jgi:vacuolar-type H+-ATPase subunit E/Vma4
MDNDSQINQLEKALLDQAESLARERLQNAAATRDSILRESSGRIEQAEVKERLSARAEADGLVRRKAQAAEGRLTAELDRLRWALTEAVLSNVRLALVDMTRDHDRYLVMLEKFIATAARRLPPGDLVAEVNSTDLNLLGPVWADLAGRAAPGRRVDLAGHGHESLGGVSVRLANNRARLDQTFEARLERQGEAMAGAIMTQMFAGPPELGGL